MVRVVSVSTLGPAAASLTDDWADGIEWSGSREDRHEDRAIQEFDRLLAERNKQRSQAAPRRVGKRLA